MKKEKVLVGLSGGVDSSVAAAKLLEQGYDVIGAFMKNWEGDNCEWAQDSNDALAIAQDLGIPFRVIDFQKEYRDLIISYLVNEYKKGLTPNPDVFCNRLVKFGVFWEAFKGFGIDYIGTGHYASTDNQFIYKGADPTKDQSYFLSNVTKDQISRMKLPLGEFHKSDVRKEAKKYGFHLHNKKDSQGLCFIGKLPFDEFIGRYIPDNEGKIKDYLTGDVLGTHKGIHYFTPGQRRGLNIQKVGPWYVRNLDAKTNTVYVVNVNDKHLLSRNSFMVQRLTLHDRLDADDLEVVIQYHDTPIKCKIDGIKVTLNTTTDKISPGQFAVFYSGNRMLGSGVMYNTI